MKLAIARWVFTSGKRAASQCQNPQRATLGGRVERKQGQVVSFKFPAKNRQTARLFAYRGLRIGEDAMEVAG